MVYNQVMKDMELLAPAGDLQSFYSAINNGADAVYLGLQSFNARDKATNFTTDNIREIVKYAHTYGVKVYLTLNTLVGDDEFDDLLDNVRICVEAKVDAYIIQDLGVASVLKQAFPNITLHASTQMGIHNLDGALMAESMGFSRVVLSRETSAKDIELIHNNTSLEIEYFVQGALCVAFSGACYLSSLEHNESGNRGRCLQLCRLPYTATLGDKTKTGYLLSTADLSLIDKLDYLRSLGVTSLKIEGRMRRPAYVAGAVREYRRALDGMCTDKGVLQKLFYRGKYNDGLYLNQSHSRDIIQDKYHNHIGVFIGKVLSSVTFKDLYKISILSNQHTIRTGDGLKFVSGNNELSMGVGNVQQNGNVYIVYSKVCPDKNAEVYLTLDSALEEDLSNTSRKIDITASLVALENEYPQLTLKCGQLSVVASLPTPCQVAKTQAITKTDVESTLAKTKDTPFVVRQISCRLGNVFLAKSQLNQLRRDAIDLLTEEILYQNELDNLTTINPDFILDIPTLIDCQHSYIVVSENDLHHIYTDIYADYRVVLAPRDWQIDVVQDVLDKVLASGRDKLYLYLPNVMTASDIAVLDNILDSFDPNCIGLVANNIYALNYATQYEVVGGYGLNVANSFTAKYLQSLGIVDYCASIENMFDVKGLSYVGNPSVMIVKHCPYKTIHDNQHCADCRYNADIPFTLTMQSGKTLKVRRVRLADCSFELISTTPTQPKNNHSMLDLRE